jgi:predicted nucleotidyltransferase
MSLEVPAWAADAAQVLPYPLLFATVSGAHLYGFAFVDSDLDLRAAHLLPAAEVVGLRSGPDTLQHTGVRDGVELDVVSHELKALATGLVTRHHAHHYLGFAAGQEKLYGRTGQLKPRNTERDS